MKPVWMQRWARRAVLAAAVMAAGQVYAHEKPQKAFLTDATLPTFKVVSDVPKPNSLTDKEDTRKLVELQKSRTDAECARAKSEEPVALKAFYGPPYGPLTDADVTRLTPFFEKLAGDAHASIWAVKDHFKRLRPYLEHRELHPCVKKEESSAYPSGHAAIARVFALVLGQLVPERADAFLARADQIAFDRVVGGVHHPSDIEQGKVLGDKIFEALMASEKFKAALSQAKAPLPP